MRVSLTHRFECDPETLWAVFDSDEFEEALGRETGVVRTLEHEAENGPISERRRRTRLAQELPGVVKKVLGADSLEWLEVATLNRDRNRLEWMIELPRAVASRIDIHGTTRVRLDGDASMRTITGEITVRIPVVGGRIESIVAKSLNESYEAAARIAREILDQRAAS